MEKQKIKVSEEAEKELADLCDKLFEWAEKNGVRYITTHIRRDSKKCALRALQASNVTYLIDDASLDFQDVTGKYDHFYKRG